MQIVIDIPEEDYKEICHLNSEQLRMLPEEVAETLMRIANGTPLCKGHGKIVDANRVLENGDNWEIETALMQTEAIIEADKTEDEEV